MEEKPLKTLQEFMDELPNRRKSYTFGINIHLGLDLRFWAIIPALNINLHTHTLEFEWLCFAVYIDKVTEQDF